MSEHEVSRPVNGQVYRDRFDAIDWDSKEQRSLLIAQLSKYTVPCDSEGKALVLNPLTQSYE